MEALAGAASIIAVIQVADRILALCGKYASAVKDAKEDIGRLASEVEAFHKVLKSVNEMANSGEMKLYISQSVLGELVGTIRECKSTLDDLELQLDSGKRRKVMNRFGLRALKWPLKSKDVIKIIEALDRHKGTITLALNFDQR